MEGFVKQSTAVNITVLMVDSTDHITGKTGLSAGLTIYATKAAGTPAVITPTVTELDATNVKGVYKLALTTAHTDTLGELQLHITATGADPSDVKWQVSTYLPGEAATLQADQAVNATKVGGTTQTARDLGASVLLSSGTGTGQLDFTSGVVKANLAQILGTALTETAGQIAAAFKQFFDVASPTGTMKQITLVNTVTTLTNAPADSSGVTTLLSRLSAARAGYLDNLSAGAVALEASVQSVLSKLLKYVQLILRKDSAIATDNATEVTAINANGGSGAGAFANTTDALEAVRDRGDAAWTTATGFSTLDAAGVRSAVGLASANLDSQIDALPTNAELSTALGTADDATLAAIAGLNNLSQANIRTAIGLASANLDTQLAALAETGDPMTLTSAERTAIANALLDLAAGVETGVTFRQAQRLILAAMAGKLSGAETTTVNIRDTGDTKNRIVATVDANGNRSAVTLDAS